MRGHDGFHDRDQFLVHLDLKPVAGRDDQPGSLVDADICSCETSPGAEIPIAERVVVPLVGMDMRAVYLTARPEIEIAGEVVGRPVANARLQIDRRGGPAETVYMGAAHLEIREKDHIRPEAFPKRQVPAQVTAL